MSFPPEPIAKKQRSRLAAIAVLAALLGLAGVSGGLGGLYTGTAGSAGNELVAAPDWAAPTVASSVIGKSQGGTPGFIRQGGSYNVYANVADAGNPPSGIASVTGDVSALTTALTATPLSSGSFAMGPTSYNYRGASLTAKAVLAAASYTYSLTSNDNLAATRTQSGYGVVVDNTAPTATAIQAVNKSGNIAGRPDIGDTVVFTNSEQLDPYSLVNGWTGATTNVTVSIENNAGAPPRDQLSVFTPSLAAVPLGVVNLGRSDYVNQTMAFGFVGVGTASTMVQSGTTTTITLGTATAATTTASSTGSMIWTPSATAFDRAGNPESVVPRTETGTVDKEF